MIRYPEFTSHSGAEQSEEPGIHDPGAGLMDPGRAAARRSEMTSEVGRLFFGRDARNFISPENLLA